MADVNVSEYDWLTVGSATEIPLLIASRTLETARTLVLHADQIAYNVADAQVHPYDDGEFEFVSLQVGRGLCHMFTIVGDNSGGVQLTVSENGRQHVVSTEMMFQGPVSLPEVHFERYGRGKKAGYDIEICKKYGQHIIEQCWNIATVASKRMKDFTYVLNTGEWPNTN